MTPRQQEYFDTWIKCGGKDVRGSLSRVAEICGVNQSTVWGSLFRAGCIHQQPEERQTETNPDGIINLSEAIHRNLILDVYDEMTNPPANGWGRRLA